MAGFCDLSRDLVGVIVERVNERRAVARGHDGRGIENSVVRLCGSEHAVRKRLWYEESASAVRAFGQGSKLIGTKIALLAAAKIFGEPTRTRAFDLRAELL